jgi:protein gp37
MSDLFHEAVPESYIRDVFSTMALEDRHIYQVLTKRTSRLRALVQKLPWLQHVWMGVTVESAAYLDRIDDLRAVPAPIRFLSLEPLLGPVRPDLTGIHWVIVGGESGPGARALEPSWARAIRDLCLDAGVPFFFKQWGGTRRARAGRILDGRVWNEYPRMRGNAE